MATRSGARCGSGAGGATRVHKTRSRGPEPASRPRSTSVRPRRNARRTQRGSHATNRGASAGAVSSAASAPTALVDAQADRAARADATAGAPSTSATASTAASSSTSAGTSTPLPAEPAPSAVGDRDTPEEVAGQALIGKTATEALAHTGFTAYDKEWPGLYEAAHNAFMAVQAAVDEVHARESLPASVEAAVPRLLLLKARASRKGSWWPHTRTYERCRYDVDVDTGEVWLAREVDQGSAYASTAAAMRGLLYTYGSGNRCRGDTSRWQLHDANGVRIKDIEPDAALAASPAPKGAGVMGRNTRNQLLIFEFECKNTPTALAHGAAIMRDPRVRVLIYGKAFPAPAPHPHALLFVVYERPAAWQPGKPGPALVATAAYDLGGAPLSARAKRQWQAGFPRVHGAADYLPPFPGSMWQRLVPVDAAPPHDVKLVCWRTVGGALVMPNEDDLPPHGPLAEPLPLCRARTAVAGVHPGDGVISITSATLRGGVGSLGWTMKPEACAQQLNIDLLQVAGAYNNEVDNT